MKYINQVDEDDAATAKSQKRAAKNKQSTTDDSTTSSSSSASSSDPDDVYAHHGEWTLNPTLWAIYDNFNLAVGLLIAITCFPYLTMVQMFGCTVWDLIDRYTLNIAANARRLADMTGGFTGQFMKNKMDGFIVWHFLWLGVCLPGYLFYELYCFRTDGFSIWRALAYNLVRVGPIYVNFMNVYVLCHKEAHAAPGGLFLPGSLLDKVLYRGFNHWVGLFHGMVPGTFTCSHMLNHHKYDNDYRDVVTTAYRPRDGFFHFLKYMSDWFYYACNYTNILAFYRERRWTLFSQTILGTAYYVVFHLFFFYLSDWRFSLVYMLWPFMEANILLAAVNFTWHAFICPDHPSNDFVNSTTVVAGQNFTLAEEYHVVHHSYAGIHWSRHQEMFDKFLPEYYNKECPGSIFHKENLFVIFGLMISQSYDKLAELYYDPDNKLNMTKEQVAEMLKIRLRCCGHEIAKRVGKQHRK